MSYTIEDLKTLMARLRDPETGCPWDTRQSYDTIVPHTIEEAYEVADAIERGEDLFIPTRDVFATAQACLLAQESAKVGGEFIEIPRFDL